MSVIRTRFAPSPTGLPHIGTVWQALMQWFFVRHAGGQFVLRIEDTDQQRFVPGSEQSILDSLAWLGITFDEGPHIGGAYGPYRQSERFDTYNGYALELVGKNNAYYCFCSPERLESLRQEQAAAKMPTGYDGQCRSLRSEDVERRLQEKAPYVVRMKMPREGVTVFQDLIRGEVRFENKLIDDQVLLKSDGWPTYHLAAVVDDHAMEITHVIRGEEWLPSTPKHLALYEMFEWTPPAFAHLPLILGSDRAKLSKRHGSTNFQDFQAQGYLPEALINFLALLGWNPKDNQEIMTVPEIIERFSLAGMNKSGAIFNEEKLRWFNAQYIRKLKPADLFEKVIPIFESAGVLVKSEDYYQTRDGRKISKEKIGQILTVVAERAEKLPDFLELTTYIFDWVQPKPEDVPWKKSSPEEARARLSKLHDLLNTFDEEIVEKEIEEKIKALIKKESLGVGDTLWPLRVALSGRRESLGPFALVALLGKQESLKRIDQVLAV